MDPPFFSAWHCDGLVWIGFFIGHAWVDLIAYLYCTRTVSINSIIKTKSNYNCVARFSVRVRLGSGCIKRSKEIVACMFYTVWLELTAATTKPTQAISSSSNNIKATNSTFSSIPSVWACVFVFQFEGFSSCYLNYSHMKILRFWSLFICANFTTIKSVAHIPTLHWTSLGIWRTDLVFGS